MKPLNLITSVVVCFLAIEATAGTMGGDLHGRDYLVNARDLSKWNFGVYGEGRDRDVKTSSFSTKLKSKSSRVLGYVGYEVNDWITPYVLAGSFNDKINNFKDSSHSMLGVGARFNLIDHMFTDPSLMDDRLNISASIQYLRSDTELGNETSTYTEHYADLTLNYINETDGDKLYFPEAIGLYVGPMYSDINSSSIDESSAFGYFGGMEFYITEMVTVHLGFVSFDRLTYSGGIHFSL